MLQPHSQTFAVFSLCCFSIKDSKGLEVSIKTRNVFFNEVIQDVKIDIPKMWDLDCILWLLTCGSETVVSRVAVGHWISLVCSSCCAKVMIFLAEFCTPLSVSSFLVSETSTSESKIRHQKSIMRKQSNYTHLKNG